MKNALLKRIEERKGVSSKKEHATEKAETGNEVVSVRVEDIVENPYQPRVEMDRTKLEELAATIKRDGLLQPIILIKDKEEGKYILIAGHRRWEAHKMLKKETIKAIVLDEVDDEKMASYAIIENLQRENLSVVELAMQYKILLQNKVYKTQRDLANSIGKNYTEVSKTISILSLPDDVLSDMKISKSIKDLKMIDMLRKAGRDEDIREIYNWVKQNNPTRNELKEKIDELKNKTKQKKETSKTFKTKETKKAYIIEIKKDAISVDVYKKILAMLEQSA